uniref:Lectin 2b n=1 Tax=Girardia tigrina TaxID=6162 RepID=Q8WSX0_GIRTI|nr:lectin 2b [Girardia tigrina]
MNNFIIVTIFLAIVGNCRSDIDANTLFVTKVLVTYNEAIQSCKARGMVLVRITSAEDNTIVNGYANKVLADKYWIDGNDHANEGTWVDARGNQLPYKNFAPNGPNGNQNENCALVYRVNGLWYDYNCVYRLWAICQRDPSQLYLGNQIEIEGSGLIVSRGKMTFADAQEYCSNRGMKMVKIGHALDNAVVHSFARETYSDYYWIDANDIVTEGKWVDPDGKELVHKNFHPGEPNGGRGENCGHGYLTIDGLWNDFPCSYQLWAICYREDNRNTNADTNTIIASHERFTFPEAQDYCKGLGLKMAKANSAAENGLIHGFTRRAFLDLYWLDGNDAKVEGKWVDSDDVELKHKGFHPGEPNGGINENCLNGYLLLDGLWNDFPCTYKNLFALCYKDGLTMPYMEDYEVDADNLMISTERYTYNEALQYCRTRGTQLVRIKNEAAKGLLAAFAKKIVADYYWIDGNDHTTEGTWMDANGRLLTYKNWANNEPNGGRAENCIISHNNLEGAWWDIPCTNKYFAICSRNPYEDDTALDVHYTKTKMTFDGAMAYCKSIGLKMIRIKDPETDRLINGGSLKHKLSTYWIDGNDNDQEDRWVDADKTELSYKNFTSGEPSGGREKNCLTVNKTGQWFAEGCTRLNRVVCYGNLKRILKF